MAIKVVPRGAGEWEKDNMGPGQPGSWCMLGVSMTYSGFAMGISTRMLYLCATHGNPGCPAACRTS